MVDDLSHEVSEEDGLSNDGEPGEQVTDTQSQQLRGHLQHGQPQQLYSRLNLRRGDDIRQRPKETLNILGRGGDRVTMKENGKSLLLPLRSPCLRWRSLCSRCGVCFSVDSSSCAWPPLRTGRSCCETA